MMKALNLRNGVSLAGEVAVADTVFSRMKGLLGRDNLGRGSALWLKPCNWVHTVGMRFPIDILFLDEGNTVVETKENVPPNRFPSPVMRAKSAIELPAGTISATKTRPGDRVDLS